MTAWLLALALAGAPAGLPGQWVFADEFGLQSWTIDIVADGRYRTRISYGGVPSVDETGNWKADGATYTIFAGGASVSYGMALSGDTLTLSGGNLAAPMTFRRAKANAGAAAELDRREAAATAEDAQWRARITLGPLVPGASFTTKGTPDANPSRVFAGATVFSPGTLYIWMSSVTNELRDDSGRSHGLVRDQMTYEFIGNGRVHIVSLSFPNRTSVNGVTKEFWGRYRVDGEQVTVETDGGEREVNQLTLGRRRMTSPHLMFDEVNWVNESLKAMNK